MRRGYRVELVVGRFSGSLCSLVPETVTVREVARRHPLHFPFGFAAYLWRHKPTHVLAAPTDISVLALALSRIFGGRFTTVVSVHDHFSTEYQAAQGRRRFKVALAQFLFKRLVQSARALIAVSEGVADDLRGQLIGGGAAVTVVSNPTVTRKTLALMDAPILTSPVPADRPYVLFAGRLVPQKGPEVLIEAFAAVADRTSAHLVLLGEGELRPFIEAEVRRHGLAERIHLVGFQTNALAWMRRAALFVLSSRHEGLPNVVIEALACGTQVVSTDCPSGPAEILEDGRLGQLVPVDDSAALADAMIRSLSGDFFVAPEELRRRAAEFSAERAADAYLACLLGASGGSGDQRQASQWP